MTHFDVYHSVSGINKLPDSLPHSHPNLFPSHSLHSCDVDTSASMGEFWKQAENTSCCSP